MLNTNNMNYPVAELNFPSLCTIIN